MLLNLEIDMQARESAIFANVYYCSDRDFLCLDDDYEQQELTDLL